jgi:hypothetical protein
MFAMSVVDCRKSQVQGTGHRLTERLQSTCEIVLSFDNEEKSDYNLKAAALSRILKPPIRAWLRSRG